MYKLNVNENAHLVIYIHTYAYICIYRETHTYIYIYIYIYTERETRFYYSVCLRGLWKVGEVKKMLENEKYQINPSIYEYNRTH
jgi:hypothetical protein